MLNNFIGGGQVFLHKVRMFKQVLRATLVVSAIAGMLTSTIHKYYFDLLMFEAFTVGLWIGVRISQDDTLYPAYPDPSSPRHSAKSSRTMAGNVKLTATHMHP